MRGRKGLWLRRQGWSEGGESVIWEKKLISMIRRREVYNHQGRIRSKHEETSA